MMYRVNHRSSYSYSEPVDLSYHFLHLTPRALPHQIVQSARIVADPAPATVSKGVDYFGNDLTYLTLEQPHGLLTIETEAFVDVTAPATPSPEVTPAWESVRDGLRGSASLELIAASEFAYPTPLTPTQTAIVDYAAQSFTAGRPIFAAARELTARIHRDFKFDPTATVVTTPVSEVMEKRRGVCQDFAHLELAALRGLGLAARYVSGYLRTHGAHKGADNSHAWISFFCPGSGWIDLDPTNNLVVGDEHIVVAWGRDYDDVSPIRGVMLGGGEHFLNVAVTVTPQT